MDNLVLAFVGCIGILSFCFLIGFISAYHEVCEEEKKLDKK